jgi:hypothetical protein
VQEQQHSHAHRRRGADARSSAARIYARGGLDFAKLPNMPTSFVKLLESLLSLFVKKIRMPKPFGKLLELLLHVFFLRSEYFKALDRVILARTV